MSQPLNSFNVSSKTSCLNLRFGRIQNTPRGHENRVLFKTFKMKRMKQSVKATRGKPFSHRWEQLYNSNSFGVEFSGGYPSLSLVSVHRCWRRGTPTCWFYPPGATYVARALAEDESIGLWFWTSELSKDQMAHETQK